MQNKLIKLLIYKDKKREYRLRCIHRNGRILFESSESYKNKSDIKRITNNWIKAILNNQYKLNEI